MAAPAHAVKMSALPSRFRLVMLVRTPAVLKPAAIASRSSQLMLVRARFSDRSAGIAVAGRPLPLLPPKVANVAVRFDGVTAPRLVPAVERDVMRIMGPSSLSVSESVRVSRNASVIDFSSAPVSPVSPMSSHLRPSKRLSRVVISAIGTFSQLLSPAFHLFHRFGFSEMSSVWTTIALFGALVYH